jgi:hypothetical protein
MKVLYWLIQWYEILKHGVTLLVYSRDLLGYPFFNSIIFFSYASGQIIMVMASSLMTSSWLALTRISP